MKYSNFWVANPRHTLNVIIVGLNDFATKFPNITDLHLL